jgi:hypothetical protein
MIVNIRDSSILKTIEPNILESYLKTKGWQEKARIYDNIAAIWRFKKEENKEYEILLPFIQNQIDYAPRINDAIKTLQKVENRSQVEILSDLITNLPNITTSGLVTQIMTPISNKLSGQIIITGILFDKLRKIKIELNNHEYILAIKAYQERLIVIFTGDLIKENDIFCMKKICNFKLDAEVIDKSIHVSLSK